MKKFTPLFLFVFLLASVFVSQAARAADDSYGGGEIMFEQPVKGVLFSHKAHVGNFGLECDSCHDKLFQMDAEAAQKAGDFNMASINQGKYCGACHNGDMAFSAKTKCASCHVKDGGDIYYTKPLKSVLFSHDVHVKKNSLGCDSCHDGLFQMKALAAQGKPDFVMASLYKGEYCGACHDGSTAFASNTRCATCHVGVKGYNRAHPEGGEKTETH